MSKDLDVSVGQWVFHITRGWGKVTSVTASERFPIEVDSRGRYRPNGKLLDGDKYPTLYCSNPLDPEDGPPYICEFTVGQVIMCRDSDAEKWKPDVFKQFVHDERWPFRGYNEIWKYCRKQTPTEKGEEVPPIG